MRNQNMKAPATYLLNARKWIRNHKSASLITGILIAANLSITIPLAAILNIWTDEAYSLNTSGGDISYAIHQSIFFEEQAPLYFLLLNLWRQLNESFFFARLFSILCISLTIYTVSVLSKKFLSFPISSWVTAAVAFNPFIIWAAVEIRLYAFSILLSTLLLLLFLETYLNNHSSKYRLQCLFILVSTLSLYTHYFLAFSLAAGAITLALLGKKRVLLNYLLDLTIVGILFFPLAFQLAHQLSSVTAQKELIDPNASQNVLLNHLKGLKTVLAISVSYLLPISRSLETNTIAKFFLAISQILRFIFLVALVFLFIKYRRLIRSFNCGLIGSFNRSLYLITLVLFTIFIVIYSLLEGVHSRHLDSLFIPVILSVFCILVAVQHAIKKPVFYYWLAASFSFYFVALCVTYSPLAKQGDYLRVASYITANEKPSQAILAFNPEVGMVFKHYYKGPNPVAVIPKEIDYQHFTWKNFVLDSEQEITTALSQTLHERSDIWLLINLKEIQEQRLYNHSLQILKHFIEQHYSITSTKEFYGSTVQLLKYK